MPQAFNNSDFSNASSWATFGHVVINGGYLYLYPGAYVKQYATFLENVQFFASGRTADPCELLAGSTNKGLINGSASVGAPTPYGEYCITIRSPAGATNIRRMDYVSYNPNSLLIQAYVEKGSSIGPGDFQFYDISSPASTTRLWDFGDGMTSTEQNPVHHFSIIGEHLVTLTTNNGKKTIIINVEDPMPAADFICSTTLGVPPLSVTFTSWAWKCDSIVWDFGDGTTSTEQNPVHVYASDGVYQVTQTATSAFGITTLTKTITVLSPPNAEFIITPKTGLTVEFEDQSTNSPSGWGWDFGENPAAIKKTAYTYKNPGIYNEDSD